MTCAARGTRFDVVFVVGAFGYVNGRDLADRITGCTPTLDLSISGPHRLLAGRPTTVDDFV